jgi:hypothetical protein
MTRTVLARFLKGIGTEFAVTTIFSWWFFWAKALATKNIDKRVITGKLGFEYSRASQMCILPE